MSMPEKNTIAGKVGESDMHNVISVVKRCFIICTVLLIVLSSRQNVLAKEGGSRKVYDQLQNESKRMQEEFSSTYRAALDNAEMPIDEGLLKIHYVIRRICPFIGIFSFTIGGFIYILARKNKGLRRFALGGLCFGLPILCIIIVVGSGVLFGVMV